MAADRALIPDAVLAQVEVARRSRQQSQVVVRSEQRDPRAATQTVGWSSPGQPMVPEWDAENAIRWAYYANVIAYRCVQIKARVVSGLPFRAGKDPRKPKDFSLDAPLARLLGPPPGGPAPKLTARRLWSWSVAQRIVTGRHAWEIEQAPGKDKTPVALWPLVSSHIEPIPTQGGAAWWQGFSYGPPGKARRSLTADQVHYGWDPSATDFRQPESCLQAARLDISIAVMMDRYNYGFLRNDARPAAVVVTEQFENRDEYRRFKQGWNGEFGGPDNAGRTAFLEAAEEGSGPTGAIDVKVLGLSQKDARFIEQHRASLERVAMAIGVPWSKLDASGRTFDNATEENLNWWEVDILPFLSDLADEVNMQLAPRLGLESGWFDTSEVRALQPTQRFSHVGAPDLLKARIATINEAREMTDLESIDDGDRFLTDDEVLLLTGNAAGPTSPLAAPNQQAPTPTEAPVRESQTEQRGQHSHLHTHDTGEIHEHPHGHRADNLDHDHLDPVPHSHGHERSSQTLAEKIDQALEGVLARRQRLTAEQNAERRAAIWRKTDAQVRTLESRWQKAFKRLFDKQQEAVLKRLKGKRGRQARSAVEADEIFTADYWRAETRSVAADLYEAVATFGLTKLTDLFGISFSLSDPWVQDFIEQRANQLAGGVTETTYEAIQEALAEGVANGESIPDLAARIESVFQDASSLRATTIARTEVISAFNGSALEGATQLPSDVVAGQEWIATADERTRDAHLSADGQVVGVGDSFDIGGESLAYPGDPSGSAENTVNCRCTIGFLTPDEMATYERGRPSTGRRVALPVAHAVVAMLPSGQDYDELSIRRALRTAGAVH